MPPVELRVPQASDFIVKTAKEMITPLSRFGVIPPENKEIVVVSEYGYSDEILAKFLAKIEPADPNLKKVDLSTDQGLFDGTVLTAAKAEAAIEVATDPKDKSAFRKLEDKVLKNVADVLVKVGGKKSLAAISSISLIATACSTVLPPKTPDAPSTLAPVATQTAIPTATETPTSTEIPTATATPDAEATKQAQQAEFEAKKAEALKMVSIKLDSPEDFATLPVLDDVNDFDSGKVQAEEYWLIDNVLPTANLALPSSWRTACNDQTGFCSVSYNTISENNVVTYHGVDAFFVMRNGKKMLRIGVEYGGKDQLIHFNFEDPKMVDRSRKNKNIDCSV